METITIWQVLTLLVFPVIGAGFWILWDRIGAVEDRRSVEAKAEDEAGQAAARDVWGAINALRDEIKTFKVDALQRFVGPATVEGMEKRFEARLDRFEAKLDRLLGLKIAGE